MKKLVLGALIIIFLFCGTNALAVSYNFSDIPSEDNIDFHDMLSATAEVSEDGFQLIFRIDYADTGLEGTFIGAIYWDFGSIEGLLELPDGVAFDADNSSEGINFVAKNNTTQNLSQSENLDEPFTTDYSITAKNANSGIDPDGHATFLFDISGSADDVREALASVQVGVHLQGVEEGEEYDADSDSYIGNPVPEPATMLLLGAGLIGIAGFGRKKLFKK
jgi:hypothetical protein